MTIASRAYQQKARRLFRLGLSWFFIFLTTAFFVHIVTSLAEPIVLNDKPFNDLLAEAIHIKLEQSRSQFQIGVLSVGFLWGFMLARDEQARSILSERPELALFACSNILFGISFFMHFSYLDSVSNVYYIAGVISDANVNGVSIPDIFDESFEGLYRYQFWTLVAAAGSTATMLVSSDQLK